MNMAGSFNVWVILAALSLTACSGDDGKDGVNGAAGMSSLVAVSDLSAGDDTCFKGGVRIDSGLDANGDTLLSADEVTDTRYSCKQSAVNSQQNFNRIASFPVCAQLNSSCNVDTATSAEIIASSEDGLTLVYTDSPNHALGFVDIARPAHPVAAGVLALDGEPTSVAVKGGYALVAVNTSADYVNVAGTLQVVAIADRRLVRSIDLGGQPDSVAVSPDGHYAAVVIENERDEELGDGAPPQLPAGGLVIIDLAAPTPADWTTRNVSLVGLATLYPADPEPEFVDINSDNIAVVTLQENNHIALIDLATGSVVNHFSAGAVDLEQIDATEEAPAQIRLTESQVAVLREPDGVAWLSNQYFATADEGDLNGGSRGFTVFNLAGEVVWHSAASLDHMAVRLGHYPDSRSGNKGNEPENVEVGEFGGERYLFVNAERSSLVFVYDIADPTLPQFKQVLPAGVAPEGGLAIPSRNLLVVASEEDSRPDKIRSVINIYQYNTWPVTYPSVQSVDRLDGTPIPWSAMSGLSSDPLNDHLLYAIEDSYFAGNRIFTLDIRQQPARVIAETPITDGRGKLAAMAVSAVAATPTAFDRVDLAALLNADGSVNIDPEGIAKAEDGGFWIASEGAGTIAESAERPITSLNMLLKTDSSGVIQEIITLPDAVNAMQVRFGFEGVAEYAGKLYVAFQRAWGGEANPRIGIYDLASRSWQFVYYPLDAPESQYAGWVGLSDIASLGNGDFLVLERDNQGGPDAAIKRLYAISLADAVAETTVSKTLVRDLLAAGDLTRTGGLVPEKVEGCAVLANGDVYIINDNDGVDDNSGETQLIKLGNILD